MAALCLSFPPVEQELELLLNFAGQQNKTKRLIGCILKWLGCSEEKKLICCSLKTKWPTLLPGDKDGLAASSTHRLGQPVLTPGGGEKSSSPNLFWLKCDDLHPSLLLPILQITLNTRSAPSSLSGKIYKPQILCS